MIMADQTLGLFVTVAIHAGLSLRLTMGSLHAPRGLNQDSALLFLLMDSSYVAPTPLVRLLYTSPLAPVV